jgi:hypothetical protein
MPTVKQHHDPARAGEATLTLHLPPQCMPRLHVALVLLDKLLFCFLQSCLQVHLQKQGKCTSAHYNGRQRSRAISKTQIKDRLQSHPLVINTSQMQDEVTCAGAASMWQTAQDNKPLSCCLPEEVHVTWGSLPYQVPPQQRTRAVQAQQDGVGHVHQAPPVAHAAAPHVGVEGALGRDAHVPPVRPLLVQHRLQRVVVAALGVARRLSHWPPTPSGCRSLGSAAFDAAWQLRSVQSAQPGGLPHAAHAR